MSKRMHGRLQLVVADLAVLLDNAGVLQSSALAFAAASAGAESGQEDLRASIGLPGHAALAWLLRARAHTADFGRTLERATRIYEDALAAKISNLGAVREVDGASATLRSLRTQGLRIAVTTCFSRAIASLVLGSVGWNDEGLLDTTVTSDEVHAHRPQPDLIFESMRRTTVLDVGLVMSVGSTPLDLAEGTIAKCRAVVGVTYGGYDHDDLHVRPHSHLVDRLTCLLDIVALHDVAPDEPRAYPPRARVARQTLAFGIGRDGT